MKIRTKKSLGTQGVKTGKNQIMVLYLTIPVDVEREDYIKDCYRKQRVMGRNEKGGSWKRIFVPKDKMSILDFPETSEERGSVLICNKVPKDNVPVVVAVLDLKSVVSYINEEKQWRQQRTFEGNVVDIDMRAQEPSIDINVASQIDDQGRLNIRVTNPNDTAELNVFVKGKVNIEAQEKFTVSTDKEFEFEIRDEDDEQVANINYTKGTGLVIEDEWGSTITMKKKSVMLKEAGGKSVEITNSLINFGKGSEFVVLGDTLKNMLGDLVDIIGDINNTIQQITVATSGGPILNVVAFAPLGVKLEAFKLKLDNILSEAVKTE